MKIIFLWSIIAFVLGLAVGKIAFAIEIIRKADGKLEVIREENEEETSERYSLNFDTPLDDIPGKKFVMFKVHVTSRKNPSL